MDQKTKIHIFLTYSVALFSLFLAVIPNALALSENSVTEGAVKNLALLTTRIKDAKSGDTRVIVESGDRDTMLYDLMYGTHKIRPLYSSLNAGDITQSSIRVRGEFRFRFLGREFCAELECDMTFDGRDSNPQVSNCTFIGSC
ncbi:MAG: hypothetical protein D6719_01460 [Candidatus Dadabacteria bacterium]|nr:MAG: hypothetical protein D6719_01460 [Candidatus Dadabacteria bacterium]